MKFKHILLLLFLVPVSLSARTLTKSEMSTLGVRAFQQKAIGIYPDAVSCSLQSCDYLRDGSGIYAAVLHFDHGFLILSAEDAVMPVLAYGFTDDIDVENLAPGVSSLLSQYKDEIAAARRTQLPANERIQNAWKELRNPSRATMAETVVAPLITARWNQNKYYNYYSPSDPESPSGYDGKVPNGCVAVAMSQIMYYYRYPESGTGSHTNYNDYGSFHVNFGQQHYCYEAMADQLNFYNNEVAKLIFHAATSVDMGYGADGSGAYSFNVPNAMSTYFRYNTDSHYRQKHDYSDSSWRQMLKADLDAARPIYYSGYSESGGHAFVCDGYNSDEYFHFNFGWGGSGNGYFLTQSSADNAVGGYNHGQSAIFNLHPIYNNYPNYCDEHEIIATEGTLEDGSGEFDYQNNTHCTYIIARPMQYNVEVTLTRLSTQESHDYLRFWNGHPFQDSLLAEFSGTIADATFQFGTDSLYITFETDDSVTDRGWHLHFNTLRDGVGCGTHVTHEPSGEISDNSDDNSNYRDNMACRWMIRIPEATYINFTFEELDISPEDHLEFYDISSVPNVLLDSYTGHDNPGVVTYYLNKIQVLFTADNYLNAAGFKIHWSTDIAGVEEFGAPVSVYPNPAFSILHVTLPDANDGCVATIYNMVGQAVFTQGYEGGQPIAIPVNGFVNGMYLLELESNGRVLHQKIMVKH